MPRTRGLDLARYAGQPRRARRSRSDDGSPEIEARCHVLRDLAVDGVEEHAVQRRPGQGPCAARRDHDRARREAGLARAARYRGSVPKTPMRFAFGGPQHPGRDSGEPSSRSSVAPLARPEQPLPASVPAIRSSRRKTASRRAPRPRAEGASFTCLQRACRRAPCTDPASACGGHRRYRTYSGAARGGRTKRGPSALPRVASDRATRAAARPSGRASGPGTTSTLGGLPAELLEERAHRRARIGRRCRRSSAPVGHVSAFESNLWPKPIRETHKPEVQRDVRVHAAPIFGRGEHPRPRRSGIRAGGPAATTSHGARLPLRGGARSAAASAPSVERLARAARAASFANTSEIVSFTRMPRSSVSANSAAGTGKSRCAPGMRSPSSSAGSGLPSVRGARACRRSQPGSHTFATRPAATERCGSQTTGSVPVDAGCTVLRGERGGPRRCKEAYALRGGRVHGESRAGVEGFLAEQRQQAEASRLPRRPQHLLWSRSPHFLSEDAAW